MFTAILIVIGTGLIAPLVTNVLKHRSGWLLALVPAGCFGYLFTFLEPVTGGETIVQKFAWFSSLETPVHFTFLIDGLSLLFGFLITGIGTFIVIYAGGYLKGDGDIGKFYLSIFLFMASMLGLVTSSNLVALFVFWEGTSFTSYLLIGYYHEEHESRRNALQALLVTSVGGLAMFAGFILLGVTAGSFEITELLNQSDVLKSHSYYVPAVLLVFAGAFTKSAQFPFHFWLPNAMAAPTPVSAYLHSATMVKAGIYLLARLQPALGGTPTWTVIVTTVGGVTMLFGAWLALCYTDLKQVLAYSTIMILGMLVMLIGMGSKYALLACSVMVIVHALYKGALFMVAGCVDHETGTRDVTQLSGLKRAMPVSAFAAAVAGLSMSGVPPMIGFVGKELSKKAALKFHGFVSGKLILAVLVIAAIGGVAAAAVVAVLPFWGGEVESPEPPHEAPVSMWIGPAFLSVLSIGFGLAPFLIDTSLVSSATGAMMGKREFTYELSTLEMLSHVGVPLIATIGSVLLGLVVYGFWNVLRKGFVLRWFRYLTGELPDRTYDLAVDGLMGTAYYQTRVLQSGKLRNYMMIIVLTGFLGVGCTLYLKTGVELFIPDFSGVFYYEWAIVSLAMLAALVAVCTRSAIASVISVGVSGASIAMFYVMLSAPDLAITQFLVETLTVVLVALVLIHVPDLPEREETIAQKLTDGVIALGAGTVLTLLMFATLNVDDFSREIPNWYGKKSYVEAFGRNVVNVILVDFRALDTLGEITVLASAGVGVFALLFFSDQDE